MEVFLAVQHEFLSYILDLMTYCGDDMLVFFSKLILVFFVADHLTGAKFTVSCTGAHRLATLHLACTLMMISE